MATTEQTLSAALALQQQGRAAEAAALYREVLAVQPQNAGAIHLLGVTYLQQRDFRAAVELIGQAIAIQPAEATFHYHLAESHRGLGDFSAAEASCREALRLTPDYPHALNTLGLCQVALDDPMQAIASFERATQL